MRRAFVITAAITVPLMLLGILAGAVGIAWSLKTEAGRQYGVCKIADAMTGSAAKDPTARANLALRGRPFRDTPPPARRGWHYLQLNRLAVPLPDGSWQRFPPESPQTLLDAAGDDLRVHVEQVPYRFEDAAATVEAPAWLAWVLGERWSRIKRPAVAAMQRDLSLGCDARRDFRSVLLDALLSDIKTVVTASGRAWAARWARAPWRFILAYDAGDTSVVRYTQKLGDDVYIVRYETTSRQLARQLLEQLERAASPAPAARLPAGLTRFHKTDATAASRGFGSSNLPTPRELCQDIVADWERAGDDTRGAYAVGFAPGSARMDAAAEATLRALAQALDERSAQVALSMLRSPEASRPSSALLRNAREGAVRYWLLRNTGVLPSSAEATASSGATDDAAYKPADLVLAELASPGSVTGPADADRLLDELADALNLPLRQRVSYIRSRRRGDERPLIGLVTPRQRGGAALDLSSLPTRLGERLDQRRLMVEDLTHLGALADAIHDGSALTPDAAATLRDCLAVDFLLVPTLTSVSSGAPGASSIRYDFTVRLIETSTLDEVGSWTTTRAAPRQPMPRRSLGVVALPFATGSEQLTPEAQTELDQALRVVNAYPGASLRIRGLARSDRVASGDSSGDDAACTALARSRQVVVESYLNASDASNAASREPAANPTCGGEPIYDHVLVEIWSERESPFLGITARD